MKKQLLRLELRHKTGLFIFKKIKKKTSRVPLKSQNNCKQTRNMLEIETGIIDSH
jgi:hypothetical protein